jgi:hypothetical protein
MRTKVAARGVAATSAIVPMQAIQDALSAEIENAPLISAMSRSTCREETL